MINYYVSPAPGDGGTGSDSNDGLTPATPKATIQAANNLVSGSRTDQVTIWLSNKGTHKTSAVVTLGVATSYAYQQYYKCWEEDTSGNYTTLNGQRVPRWVWERSAGDRFHGTTSASGTHGFVHFFDGKLSCTTDLDYGLTLAAAGSGDTTLFNIEFDTENITSTVIYGASSYVTMLFCKLVSAGPNYPTRCMGLGGMVGGYMGSCLFSGSDQEISSFGSGIIEGCVFKNWGVNPSGIDYALYQGDLYGTVIRNNVFHGNGASKWGLMNYQASTNNNVYNNVFYNVQYGAGDYTSGNQVHNSGLVGHNAFYQVTTPYAWRGGIGIDMTPYDLTLTEDPFMDVASNDYRLKPGCLCRGAGLVINGGVWSDGVSGIEALRCDIGAIQYGIPALPIAGPGYIR